MKKFFAFAITAMAMVVAFSSCKKDEITDDQLTANIVANQTYKGDYLIKNVKDDEAIMAFTKSASTGVQDFACSLVTDEPDPADPTSIYMIGTWSVSKGVLTLKCTAVYGDNSKTATVTGTVEKSGDSFTLTSDDATFKMEKYKVK